MSAASSTVVIHTLRNDNSYRPVSAFMSQQESATCEDVLHFNLNPSFNPVLGVQLSLLPGLFGGEECMPAVADNSSRLTDRCPYAGGEDCQSRLRSHFLSSSHPSPLPERGIPRQWCLEQHFLSWKLMRCTLNVTGFILPHPLWHTQTHTYFIHNKFYNFKKNVQHKYIKTNKVIITGHGFICGI